MALVPKANQIRNDVINLCAQSKSGHAASSLSCVDILVALYYGGFIDPKNDRVILSKGHAFAAQLVILCDLGIAPRELLDKFGKEIPTHPDHNIPGVFCTTGSLGHGIGIAVGAALADKMDNVDRKTVVIVGDGETCEGSVWEAANFAGRFCDRRLFIIVDCNGKRCLDTYYDTRLCERFSSWGVPGGIIYCGHDVEELARLFTDDKTCKTTLPRAFIIHTEKGHGCPELLNLPPQLMHTAVPGGD